MEVHLVMEDNYVHSAWFDKKKAEANCEKLLDDEKLDSAVSLVTVRVSDSPGTT